MIKRLLVGLAFLLFPSLASANCVVGATGVVGTGTCSKAGSVLIATQTASSSANIQFSGVNFSNSYHQLRLECSLTPSVDGYVYVVLGEGAGPAWQTAAAYYTQGVLYEGGAAYPGSTTTSLGIAAVTAYGGNIFNSNMILDSPSLSTFPKLAFIRNSTPYYTGTWAGAPGIDLKISTGYLYGDNSPVTGLEIYPSSGTISGSCELYGELS